MPAPFLGGCSCGDIRFAITSEPLALYACHCTDCQRSSGTAFTMTMLVDRASFSVEEGEPVQYSARLAVGKMATGFMCGNCSTRLWRVGRKSVNLLALRAGTLDQTSWFRPVAHFWTRSAQPWVTFPKDSVLYETQPLDGWQEVIRLSQSKNAPPDSNSHKS